MKSVQEIISGLAPSKYAVFVSGDPGMVAMQEDLKRLKLQEFAAGRIKQSASENPNGVFIRFSTDGSVHSGIIQAEDSAEIRGMLLDLPLRLKEEGANLLTIQRIPMNRIPAFPFFTVLEDTELREPRQKMSQQYWSEYADDTEALRNWHLDLLKFRREIVNMEIPQLEAAVPSWMSKIKVYILHNEERRTIATRYYRSSEDEDIVLVKRTSEIVGLHNEKAFADVFDLPSKQDAILEVVQSNIEGEKAYSKWDHPYFSAVDDVRKQVEKFNQAQPRILYDAHSISNAFVYNWTYKEILKTREIASRSLILEEALKRWLQPIQAVVLYFINEPSRGEVTDGIITAQYVNGPHDELIVKKVGNKEDAKWKDKLVQQYFPASTGEPFSGFTSSILYYLRDKFDTGL